MSTVSDQVAIRCRASAFGGLFDCAHRWEGQHILGLTMPSSPRATLGSGFHAGTAAFDSAKCAGSPISINDAAGAAVDELKRRGDETDWSHGDLTPREVERRALTLHSLYCASWSPKYQFEAVEATINPLRIDCGGGVVIELTGTLDRCRTVFNPDGQLRRILDLKSGARAVVNGRAETARHWPQVGIYELLYEDTTGQPVDPQSEILGASTSGAPEIASSPVFRARERLLGVEGEYRGLIEYAAEHFRTGLFPPNPQSSLCSPRYCARWKQCRFHD